MGSFNGVCHLSGMGIAENEPVIMIPVAYNNVTDTTTHVYSSSPSAHIAGFPILGTYDGFNSVDVIDNLSSTYLTHHINTGLMNFKQNQKQKRFFGERFFILKREHFEHDYENLSFFNDIIITNKIKDVDNLHDIQHVNHSNLFKLLSGNHLCSVSGDIVARYGLILIKQSFFNALVDEHYSGKFDTLKNNIHHYLHDVNDIDLSDTKSIFRGSIDNRDYFSSEVVNLFNDRFTFSHPQYNWIFKIKKLCLLKNHVDETAFIARLSNFIEITSMQALIAHIYSDIGKTFYPNAASHRDMKPLYNFANTLASQIDKARTTNLNEYSPENGYDQEFQEKQQWTTPNIY